jgi:carbon storage regulator
MRRRAGEAILLGEDIEIRILEVDRSRVKIGISAPREVTVRSCAIELVRDENRAAALSPGAAPALLARLLHGPAIDNNDEKRGPTVR